MCLYPRFCPPVCTRHIVAMVVEGINVEDIFYLVSLVVFFNISWTFRIMAHEEDQYSYVYKILNNFFCLQHSNSLNSLLLKGLAQAKIIKKSVILFRVLNITI